MPSPWRQPTGLPAACPLTFTIDGHTYTLPALDTRTWLDALVLQPPACWWQLLPARLGRADGEHLFTRLIDAGDPFDLDDLEHVATTVLAAACGVDFWAATRLAAMVYANWLAFDGWSYTRGLDPLAVPIPRVLAAAYAWRRSLCEKKTEATRLDADIWAPPPERTASGARREAAPAGWDDDQEAAIFSQALAATGGARGGA